MLIKGLEIVGLGLGLVKCGISWIDVGVEVWKSGRCVKWEEEEGERGKEVWTMELQKEMREIWSVFCII